MSAATKTGRRARAIGACMLVGRSAGPFPPTTARCAHAGCMAPFLLYPCITAAAAAACIDGGADEEPAAAAARRPDLCACSRRCCRPQERLALRAPTRESGRLSRNAQRFDFFRSGAAPSSTPDHPVRVRLRRGGGKRASTAGGEDLNQVHRRPPKSVIQHITRVRRLGLHLRAAAAAAAACRAREPRLSECRKSCSTARVRAHAARLPAALDIFPSHRPRSVNSAVAGGGGARAVYPQKTKQPSTRAAAPAPAHQMR
jgi:hypothetical protein